MMAVVLAFMMLVGKNNKIAAHRRIRLALNLSTGIKLILEPENLDLALRMGICLNQEQ